MIEEIKLIDYPHTSQTVNLSGKDFKLEFRQNVAHNHIGLDILNNDGEPIVCGMKVVYGMNLLGGVKVAELPSGTLIFFKIDPTTRIAGYTEDLTLLYSDVYYDDYEDLLKDLQ
jgi:hypothetical protein